MAEPKPSSARSPAAQEASRRNGAKSRGPRSAAGKAKSAKNALRHGLRARQPVLPEDLPDWVKGFEASMVAKVGYINQERREFLDRLLLILVLIDRADRLITAEFARIHAIVGDGAAGESKPGSRPLREELNLSTLRKLLAYRKRFRAQRDQCIRKIKRYGRLGDPGATS